jgi:hypothetical protein
MTWCMYEFTSKTIANVVIFWMPTRFLDSLFFHYFLFFSLSRILISCLPISRELVPGWDIITWGKGHWVTTKRIRRPLKKRMIMEWMENKLELGFLPMMFIQIFTFPLDIVFAWNDLGSLNYYFDAKSEIYVLMMYCCWLEEFLLWIFKLM